MKLMKKGITAITQSDIHVPQKNAESFFLKEIQ